MQVPPTFLVVFEKYTSSPWITLTRFQTPNLGKFHLDKNLGLERLDFIVQRESKHPVVQRPLVGWCLLFQRILTTISPLVILALQKGQYKLSLPAQDEADKISDLKSTFGTYLESRQTRAHTHTHTTKSVSKAPQVRMARSSNRVSDRLAHGQDPQGPKQQFSEDPNSFLKTFENARFCGSRYLFSRSLFN